MFTFQKISVYYKYNKLLIVNRYMKERREEMGYRTEEETLKHYDPDRYPRPVGYTSDIAVFTMLSEELPPKSYKVAKQTLAIMLIQRSEIDAEGNANIEGGKWALPGGFVHHTESAKEAAVRELEEETGVTNLFLKHYGVYDKPGRDKRGWIISNAFYAVVPEEELKYRKANDDAQDVQIIPVEEALTYNLAFDHKQVIEDAVAFVKKDLLETHVAKHFLPKEFTASELRMVLLTATDAKGILIESQFARKIKTIPFVEEVPNKTTQRNSKSGAKLYRFKEKSEPVLQSQYL